MPGPEPSHRVANHIDALLIDNRKLLEEIFDERNGLITRSIVPTPASPSMRLIAKRREHKAGSLFVIGILGKLSRETGLLPVLIVIAFSVKRNHQRHLGVPVQVLPPVKGIRKLSVLREHPVAGDEIGILPFQLLRLRLGSFRFFFDESAVGFDQPIQRNREHLPILVALQRDLRFSGRDKSRLKRRPCGRGPSAGRSAQHSERENKCG